MLSSADEPTSGPSRARPRPRGCSRAATRSSCSRGPIAALLVPDRGSPARAVDAAGLAGRAAGRRRGRRDVAASGRGADGAALAAAVGGGGRRGRGGGGFATAARHRGPGRRPLGDLANTGLPTIDRRRLRRPLITAPGRAPRPSRPPTALRASCCYHSAPGHPVALAASGPQTAVRPPPATPHPAPRTPLLAVISRGPGGSKDLGR